MKSLWFLSMVLYAFIDQKHTAITATSTDLSRDTLIEYEQKLVNEFSSQIRKVLQAINAPEVSLGDDDPPRVQNITKIYGDELLKGNLMMYDTVIDGLSNIEDAIRITKDELEIHMTLNLEKLVIHGKFALETPTVGAVEKGTFSVVLINVTVEGTASLLANPDGHFVITKVVPIVSSEESHVTVKSQVTPPSGPILKSSLMHLQNNIEKRFAKIAYLEVYTHYPRKSDHTLLNTNWTIFEAQRFVSQRYDPYRLNMAYDEDNVWAWHKGAFFLSGFSNFHLEEFDFIETDTSVDIIVRVVVNDVHGTPTLFFFQHDYIGDSTIEKMDFIAKIKLMSDNSQKFPILAGLGLAVTGCKCHFREKVTGMYAGESEFGFDVEDLYCLLIRNEISTSNIMKTIQTEILNKMELSHLKERIDLVRYAFQNLRSSEASLD